MNTLEPGWCVCLGVVAECQQERSQLKNKEKAMKALRAKLYSMKLEEETSKRYNQRKIQVSSATCNPAPKVTLMCQGSICTNVSPLDWHQRQVGKDSDV